MNDSFSRFGGISAILVGVLSLLYAVFYLVISRQAETLGLLGSWLILGASGIFSSAAYVALYRHLRNEDEGFALWGMILGVAASFATLLHGGYEALLLTSAGTAVSTQQLPSQVDPAGLATFFVVGLAAFIFSRIIVRSAALPKNLGYLGLFNAVLLIILFFASAGGVQTLILISGGLTSVIIGPIWWIWLGTQLRQTERRTVLAVS
jgi:hypothetical protein